MESSRLHGSANWSTNEGADSEDAFNGFNALFGRVVVGGAGDTSKNRFLAIDATKRHFLSIAPTRSGKGVSLIIPNLLLYRGSVVCIDPKGENAWITAKYRRDRLGQKTIILDPWGEVNRRYGEKAGELETVSCFNPLSILDPASDNYADDLAYLVDALIINEGKDPHWDNSARELVAGLVAFSVENPETSAEASLPRVRALLSRPADVLRQIAEKAQAFGHESVAARKLGRFTGDSGELNSIISCALTQTAFLDSAALAKNLESSDFGFEALLTDEGATIYLVLPVDKLQTYGRWLRLMISIGIRTVARNVRKLPLPVIFMLDEFGTIGKLSAVEQAYGLMAGLQMTLWAFVQDLIQLKRDYPDSWETFIANSQGVSFMNAMDQTTCEYVSKMLGTKTVEDLTVGTLFHRGLQSGKTPREIAASTNNPTLKAFASSDLAAQWAKSGMNPGVDNTSDRYHGRSLLQPSEARLWTEHYGVFAGRSDPYLFEPILYYDEPFFLERARPDPHFAQAATEGKTEEAEMAAWMADYMPDFETAKAKIEKEGLKVRKAAFGGKITITTVPGGQETFPDKAAALVWMRWAMTLALKQAQKNEKPGQREG